ncbi:unnamed protein product, partial [Iphiclides podalirius]
MASDKKCCVPGCLETGETLHAFPNPLKDLERFKAWYTLIGGPNLLGLTNDHIYKYRRVCHAHFEKGFCCRYNRISKIAIPTLKMPVSDPKLHSRSCSIQQSIESSFRSAPSTSKDLALQSIPTGSNRQPMQSIENVLQNVSSTIKFSDPKLHSRRCSVQQSIESTFRSAPSTSKECTRTKRRIYKATTFRRQDPS